MIGDLSKLFDRNFAVGYFLPVAIFITTSTLIINSFFITLDIANIVPADLLLGTTLISLLSWIGGIVLNAINRDLYRLIEGYGKYNPLRLFYFFEKFRFERLTGKLIPLIEQRDAYSQANQKIPNELQGKLIEMMSQFVEEFPDEKKYLLPTPFGNVLRAFEVYPRMMYKIEAIAAWERLLAVIPKDYVDMVNTSKAQVDFWVNLALAIVLLQIEYVGLVFIMGTKLSWWIIALFIVFGTIALLRATSSAKEWGAFVKSAFDMFLPKMRESLGFTVPKNRTEEQDQWKNFSQAISYHLPEHMPELKHDEKITEPTVGKSGLQAVIDLLLNLLGIKKK